KEHDPGGDIVRPAETLRLLLVLAEVPGCMDELLRDDRGTKRHVRERMFAPVRACHATGFEVRAHRRHVQLDDLIASELADKAVVEGDELHAGPLIFIAARA